MAVVSRAPTQSTSARGLDQSSFPMRLWHKAKRLGTWDPRDIDFSQDIEDWETLADDEREILLHLSTLFLAGEETVTRELLPLLGVMARQGRLEEELYLTSFLFEEAKHVEVFRRFIDEVAEQQGRDLTRFEGTAYQRIFYDELPRALDRLWRDDSPIAVAEASVTYNMIVEGVLAETGYFAFQQVLVDNDIMPGMQQVTRYLNLDESRHIAYGVFLLSRLVAEHGKPVWRAIEKRMFALLQPALDLIAEALDPYDPPPFGIGLDTFIAYATKQFHARYGRIEKARRQSLDELDAAHSDAIEELAGA